MKHETCGNIYFVTPNHFKDGKRCPKCSHRNIRKTTEEFKSEVEKCVGREYSVLGKYETNMTKIKIKHETCGNIYLVEPVAFLKGHRCPKCSHGSIRLSQNEVEQEILNILGPEYKLISEYTGRSKKIKIEHLVCGTIFETSRNSIRSYKTGCPRCKDYSTSKEEMSLFEYIKSIYNGPIEKKKIEKREIDIYLPDLKIGFEFDGLYWHSTKFVDKNYHKDKTNFFLNKDIRIVHIFEDEWKFKNEITKSKIKNIIKLNTEKIFARKTTVKEISVDAKNEFLEKYHIQGKDVSSIKLGLFYNNELVSVMTFSKPRISLGQKNNKEDAYELSRFASSKNIVGGFSKLLKYAIRNYSISEILTFADLRWSSANNNVYEKNGFKLDHISEPNYFYIKGSQRFHRYTFTKQKIKQKFPDLYKDKLTEKEIMKAAGYLMIYDCGNLVYKLEV